jgi:lysyl-tRNA synthetase class 1
MYFDSPSYESFRGHTLFIGSEPMSWPFEQACILLDRVGPTPRLVTFATGFGASGTPHAGSFSENVRTEMVRNAFRQITSDAYPTRLIVFSDDYDGFRRVPDGMPSSMEEDLNRPLTSVRDPSGQFSSFAERNNNIMREFVNSIIPDYEFISATDCYRSGRFNVHLLNVLSHYGEIMDVMLPTLSEQRRATYSPVLPIDPVTDRILQVPLQTYDPLTGDIVFFNEENEEIRSTVLNGEAKNSWKVDWAMRWGALGIDYEMSGKDLIDSVKASSKIARVLGHQPPVGMTYELFLDENGEKISKSRGNGVSVEEWLRYGTREALSMFMFQNPRAAKKLHVGLIPRVTDDYLKALAAYGSQTPEERLDNPVWHIHAGNPPAFSSDVSYALLINLASVSNATDPSVLSDYLSTYRNIASEDRPIIEALLPLVIAYCEKIVFPAKVVREPTDIERTALRELADVLGSMDDGLDGEAYQFEVYEVGKRYTFPSLRDWFRAIYEVIFGSSDGPRFGTFVAAYGRIRSVELIRSRL